MDHVPTLRKAFQFSTAKSLVQLLRWLGPWSDPDRSPTRVAARDLEIPADGGRPAMRARVVVPTRKPRRGSYLVAQGLSLDGPDDPRLDRFLRVLAGSGFVVMAPFLPDYMRLRVRPGVREDFYRAYRAFLALDERPPHVRPGLFGISFGVLPALRLASDPRAAAGIGATMVFGGYADLVETMRFAVRDGEDPGAAPHDPLSVPAVALNVLEHLVDKPDDVREVVEAWYEFVRRTWGRPEMRDKARYRAVARELEQALPASHIDLFVAGCGLTPMGRKRVLEAVEALSYDPDLDPRAGIEGIRCPVHLVHGLHDDVIAPTQLHDLAASMPADTEVHTYLTGLHGHTRHRGVRELLGHAPALVREVHTMFRMARAIVSAGTRLEQFTLP